MNENIQLIVNKANNINLNLTSNYIKDNKINSVNSLIEDINNSNNINIPKIRNIFVNEKDLLQPIGILDPLGLKNNPLTNEPYQNIYYNPDKELSIENPTYEFLGSIWSKFPMYSKREESIKAIYNNQVILVISGTGSGKTVLAPKFALHVLNYQGRIAITNPKRAPTQENTEFSAKCLGVEIGTFVGMKYRESDPKAYSPDCRLIYVTDGWILQKLQKDPMLLDLDVVIIDEAHERGIQIDLLLLLLKELILKRPTFKLIIMSATINSETFTNYFPTNKFKFAMIDAGELPNYPIEEIFLQKPINKFDSFGSLIGDSYIEAAVDKAVELLRKHEKCDILVFFPSKNDTSNGCMLLHRKLEKLNRVLDKKIYCTTLTSATDKETQKLITHSSKYTESGIYSRKVIFATEVAESSITFYGLNFVIDTGLVNNNIFYADKNITSLEKNYISKASHKQRKGRTGRTGPGTCFNLFTKDEYEKFREYAITPITTEDISVPLMFFLSRDNLISHIDFPISYKNINKQKKGSLTQFLNSLIEIPSIDTIKHTINRFIALKIIDVKKNKGTITDLGRGIAQFEMIPELGVMIISGYNHRCRDDIINLAVILDITEYRMDNIFEKFRPSSKDPTIKSAEKKKYDKVKSKWINSMGDHFSLIDIYNNFYSYKYDTIDRKTGQIIRNKKGDAKQWCRENFLHFKTLDKVRDKARQINQNFGKVMRIFREKHPMNAPTYIFTDIPPKISDKRNENILKAIFDGFYINLLKKVDKSKYINCFPEKKTACGISQESLYAKVKNPTNYAIYSQLKSIFGKMNYSVVSKVSPSMIDEISTSDQYQYVESCLHVDKKKDKKH